MIDVFLEMVSKFIILAVFAVLISTAFALNTTQTSMTSNHSFRFLSFIRKISIFTFSDSCPAELFLNAIIPFVCDGYPGENVVCQLMCRKAGFPKGHCRMIDGKSECVCRNALGSLLALADAIAQKLREKP